jgi:hypothetical protein
MDFDIAFTTSATPASQQAIVFVPSSGGNGMFTVAPLVDVVSQSRTVATPLQATQGGIVLAQGGTNGITISSGTVALSASTVYKFRVHVYPQGA